MHTRVASVRRIAKAEGGTLQSGEALILSTKDVLRCPPPLQDRMLRRRWLGVDAPMPHAAAHAAAAAHPRGPAAKQHAAGAPHHLPEPPAAVAVGAQLSSPKAVQAALHGHTGAWPQGVLAQEAATGAAGSGNTLQLRRVPAGPAVLLWDEQVVLAEAQVGEISS